MSTTGRPDGSAPGVSDIASQLREAGLVRVVAGATADAVAATGVLATALEADDIAHQCSVVPVPESTRCETDADLTVEVGRRTADADISVGTAGTPASTTALAVATELGTVDYELGLAGSTAAGVFPDSDTLAAAQSHGIERRPGVAIPTGDLEDGLAHSSLVHLPFSGDTEAVRTVLGIENAEEEATRRRVASLVAFEVCGDGYTPRAAEAVERFLRPLVAPSGQFETVEGYGDVLDATARERPGLALALALGGADSEAALDVWRRHTQQAHAAVRAASTGRYDGLYVVRSDGDQPVGTLARLVAEYRSPEPLVLAVDDSDAVALAVEEPPGDLGARTEAAARRVDGRGGGTATVGRASFDCDPTEFVVTFREER